jgi:hypothetical protein
LIGNPDVVYREEPIRAEVFGSKPAKRHDLPEVSGKRRGLDDELP